MLDEQAPDVRRGEIAHAIYRLAAGVFNADQVLVAGPGSQVYHAAEQTPRRPGRG
jgi:hypothetical protein